MTEPKQRITTSEIIRRMLEKGSSEHSSVTLARNSKGDVQIEVIVRTGESEHVSTVEQAEQLATAVYDRLADKYAYGERPPAA